MKMVHYTFTAALCAFLCACGNIPAEQPAEGTSAATTAAETAVETKEETTSATTKATEKKETTAPETTRKSAHDVYETVDVAFIDESDGTTVIQKILGKETTRIYFCMIIKDADENVIGKEEDVISVVEGEYNYFRFKFDIIIPHDAWIDTQVAQRKSKNPADERAEMTAYNQVDNKLYVTFRKTGDIPSGAKFKLLFYKDDEIVHDEHWYFDIKTNLVDSRDGSPEEDVAEIRLPRNLEYDDIEYIYDAGA